MKTKRKIGRREKRVTVRDPVCRPTGSAEVRQHHHTSPVFFAFFYLPLCQPAHPGYIPFQLGSTTLCYKHFRTTPSSSDVLGFVPVRVPLLFGDGRRDRCMRRESRQKLVCVKLRSSRRKFTQTASLISFINR